MVGNILFFVVVVFLATAGVSAGLLLRLDENNRSDFLRTARGKMARNSAVLFLVGISIIVFAFSIKMTASSGDAFFALSGLVGSLGTGWFAVIFMKMK